MKKLVFIFIILLCCSVIQVNAWAEKKVLNWSPPSNSIASGSVTRANTKISAVDGTAFVDFSTAGVLTNYAANKYRKLTLTDSKGKKLVGYIKAAGTGETYGSELVSTWVHPKYSAYKLDTLTVDGLDITYGQRLSSGYWEVAGSGYTSPQIGACIVYAQTYTNISGTNIISLYLAQSTGTSAPYLLLGSRTMSGKVTINQTYPVCLLVSSAASEFSLSNFTMRQLLTPSTTGVTITSTPDGSTYNWATKESGFNYNDASGYTYTIERE